MQFSGILNVNKPLGMTSREAVDRVKRIVRPEKTGHAGTLDPLATGVLVVCAGQATRLISYIQGMPKAYSAAFRLGATSITDDLEAEVVPVDVASEPSAAVVESTVARFIGQIAQRPPEYSAVKSAGQRAYARARRGETFELPPRNVTIHGLAIRRYDYPELELEIECGSGTYVRALGRDIGRASGTGAVMTALERTAIGPFRVEDAIAIDRLSRDTLAPSLQPALTAVAGLPRVLLSEEQQNELSHGRPVARPAQTEGTPPDQEWVAVTAGGELAAILFEKRDGELWPRVNFVGL